MNATLKVALTRQDIKVRQLAKAMRVSESTMYDRLSEPDKMSVGDFRRLSQALNLTLDEVREVIGWEGK